ncbi:PGR5-like protein [Gracilaria domingensis]|nr:PGR5-like protein [Gracilaria domingensis]
MAASDGGPTSSNKPASSSSAAPSENGATAPKSNGKPLQSETEVVLDENIGGFCSINPRTGRRLELSLRAKESLFLDAVQAYFRGKPIVSNAEFDALKDELTWQGSDVISLDRDEFRFLEAAKSYERGAPTMPDEEFDELKTKLMNQGSVVAIQRGPRCSVKRQLTFSDVITDKRRTFVLYVPAGILFGLIWLSLAFELTPLHSVDPVISLVLGSPAIVIGSRLLTGLVVPKAEIMVGDCPSCGRRTHVLFGNVLNQAGFQDTADVKCDKCKASLKVERSTNRMILVAEGK